MIPFINQKVFIFDLFIILFLQNTNMSTHVESRTQTWTDKFHRSQSSELKGCLEDRRTCHGAHTKQPLSYAWRGNSF
jgi:hypothetical protein